MTAPIRAERIINSVYFLDRDKCDFGHIFRIVISVTLVTPSGRLGLLCVYDLLSFGLFGGGASGFDPFGVGDSAFWIGEARSSAAVGTWTKRLMDQRTPEGGVLIHRSQRPAA
jgi:hypothetical protein